MAQYGYGSHQSPWQGQSNTQQPEDDPEKVGLEALRVCQDLQHMIDINSDHLERLRTPLTSTASALTKQEIRTLEGKLIKHFSKQLATRASLTPKQHACVETSISSYPSLSQWLAVVGISKDSAAAVETKVSSVDVLKDKTDSELHRMLLLRSMSATQRQEDLRRLSKAIQHLKKYTDTLLHERPGAPDPNKLELYWDSWDHSCGEETLNEAWQATPLTPSTSKIPKVDHGDAWRSEAQPQAVRRFTPPQTPPINAMFGCKVVSSNKFPSTPPPNRRNNTGIKKAPNPKEDLRLVHIPTGDEPNGGSNEEVTATTQSHPSSQVTKTRTNTTSSTRTAVSCSESPICGEVKAYKQKKTSEPSPSALDSPPVPKSPKSPPNVFENPEQSMGSHNSLQVPKSPAPSMGHVIRHRFNKTFKPSKCDLCLEYMFNGLKCKECKYRCHKDCELRVPPSCGLPEDLVKYYYQQISKGGSPILPRLPHSPSTNTEAFPKFMGGPGPYPVGGGHSGNQGQGPAYPESSSNTSSCTSSTPSSPNVILVTSNQTPPNSATMYNHKTSFPFPDNPVNNKLLHHHQQQLTVSSAQPSPLSPQQYQQPTPAKPSSPLIDSVKSYDSDKTLSGKHFIIATVALCLMTVSLQPGSSGSVGTAVGRLDSQDSNASVDDSSLPWHSQRLNSFNIQEWDIPYEEINIGVKIGSGRFSTGKKDFLNEFLKI